MEIKHYSKVKAEIINEYLTKEEYEIQYEIEGSNIKKPAKLLIMSRGRFETKLNRISQISTQYIDLYVE